MSREVRQGTIGVVNSIRRVEKVLPVMTRNENGTLVKWQGLPWILAIEDRKIRRRRRGVASRWKLLVLCLTEDVTAWIVAKLDFLMNNRCRKGTMDLR
jgi:hypothetical protein